MTKQEIRSILLKSCNGEHGLCVLKLFEDYFCEEGCDQSIDKNDVDCFLRVAIEMANVMTRLNVYRNRPKVKRYTHYSKNTCD